MSESQTMTDTHLTSPTLLLDIGSLRTTALLALPEKKSFTWPCALLNSEHPVSDVMAFLKASHLPILNSLSYAA